MAVFQLVSIKVTFKNVHSRLFHTVPASAGSLKSGCAMKQYLLTNESVTNTYIWNLKCYYNKTHLQGDYKQAWTICCQYGMVPFTPETYKEITCIKDLFKNSKGKWKQELLRTRVLKYL